MSWLITPSQPVPLDSYRSNVSLLLHGDGANGSTTITDNSPTPKTVTAVGNAQISTAQSKFGGASVAFDGTGDYAQIAHSDDLDISGGAFTVEAWVRTSNIAFTTYQSVFSKRIPTGLSAAGYTFGIKSNGSCVAWNGSTELNSSGISLASNTWYHIAWCHTGSNMQIFVDGVRYLNTPHSYSSNTYAVTLGCALGNSTSSDFLSGFIDDMRVTKGVARYTGTFTPPTAAFPDI
jgi:hypothetical protein